MMATAKRTVVDDVPGIFKKPKRIPLRRVNRKLTKAEADAAEKALDEWANAPPWRVWFDALGPQLTTAAKSSDANVCKAAQYALSIWRCISDDLAKPAHERRSAEWYVEWAMKLRWEMAKVNLWPLDGLTKTGRRMARAAINAQKARKEKAAALRRRRQKEAEQALSDAAYKFPQHADNPKLIKKKATELLGKPDDEKPISRRTLTRRLGGK